MQPKLSDKQLELLKKLYIEQRRKLTPNVVDWLQNLPAVEASKFIDKWIAKNRKRRFRKNH